MRVRLFLLFFVAGVSLLPYPCGAEYYRYVDSKGILHFTDNPGEAPKDSQHTIQKFSIPEDTLITPRQDEENPPAPDSRSQTGRPPRGNASGPPGGKHPAPSANESAANSATTAQAGPPSPGQKPPASPPNPIAAELTDLKSIQHDLAIQHDQLIEEQKQLEEKRKAAKSREDFINYNLAVNEFNKRALAYEQKRAAYDQRARAINEVP